MNYLQNLFGFHALKSIILSVGIIYLAFLLSDVIWFFAPSDYTNNIEINKKFIVKTYNKLPINLFGREVKIVKKIVKKIPKKIIIPKLNLILIGIISNKKESFAIIKASERSAEKIYKVGDKINSFAKVKQINYNFIIIDHGGKDKKIILKFKATTKLNQKLKSKNYINNQIIGFKKEQKEINSRVNTKIKINKPYNDKKITSNLQPKTKKKLRSYLYNMKRNPASVLSIVSVQPNFISGLLNGFKIYPAKEKKLFFKIGFKKGDIIVKINDIELNSLSKAFKIGRELTTVRVFNFVVLRNDIEHYIYLDLN